MAGSAEEHLLDTLLALCREQKLLSAHSRQRTDSTHVLGAVRSLNRLECVTETLRAALNALVSAAPEWLRMQADLAWVERYGRRANDYDVPRGEANSPAVSSPTQVQSTRRSMWPCHRFWSAMLFCARAGLRQMPRSAKHTGMNISWRGASGGRACSPPDTATSFACSADRQRGTWTAISGGSSPRPGRFGPIRSSPQRSEAARIPLTGKNGSARLK